MQMEKEKLHEVIMDCINLSDGTLATLTGKNRYEELDKIRADFVSFALQTKIQEGATWMDLWDQYYIEKEENWL